MTSSRVAAGAMRPPAFPAEGFTAELAHGRHRGEGGDA